MLLLSSGGLLCLGLFFLEKFNEDNFNLLKSFPKTFSLAISILCFLISFVFLIIYNNSSENSYSGYERKIKYNQKNMNRLEKKFKLDKKEEKIAYKKRVYLDKKDIIVKKKLIIIESDNISLDVLYNISDEKILFEMNSIDHIGLSSCEVLYILFITNSATQIDTKKIQAEVFSYGFRGGAKKIIIPFIIDKKGKKIICCDLKYKYVQDVAVYQQRRKEFIKYLERIELIKCIQNKISTNE